MKPIVDLLGRDGNAFVILGACQSAARKAGWTKKQIDEFMGKAMSADYDNLLYICQEYFEIE